MQAQAHNTIRQTGEPTNDTRTRVLSPNEVAALLQIRYKTVLELAKRGEIPHFRVGRLVRFDEAALTDWIRGGAR
jgi:excisionase family DNA binding protein